MKESGTQLSCVNEASKRRILAIGCVLLLSATGLISDERGDRTGGIRMGHSVPIGLGWARNSVNATIFRTHSVTTHKQWQYASYYDAQSNVILARRELGTDTWEIQNTGFSGNSSDAHNGISIAVDGEGFIHIAWDHHGHPLRYARSVRPGAFEFERLPMTGQNEMRVTYPEFFNLADGGLLALYRDGGSGRGDTMLNRYDRAARSWSVVQHPLISGEGDRNAYPNQIAVDHLGRWHISWNWRETGDVASNHNLCYAVSDDQGKSWRKSTGERYKLPITHATAEVVAPVSQNSELINTCSTAVDSKGNPMIASFWRPSPDGVPQYMLVWNDGKKWRTTQVSRRTSDFSLSGTGSRRLPMSRPKLAVDAQDRIYFLFRDEERGNRISVATTRDPARKNWTFFDLSQDSVGLWEPGYDVQLWQRDGLLHLFKQRVGQGEGETLENIPPQMVSILEWTPPPTLSKPGAAGR
jgi:hypothetical protein